MAVNELGWCGGLVVLLVEIGLAIHGLWVKVMAGHHHILALGKLFKHVCLCHQAV